MASLDGLGRCIVGSPELSHCYITSDYLMSRQASRVRESEHFEGELGCEASFRSSFMEAFSARMTN